MLQCNKIGYTLSHGKDAMSTWKNKMTKSETREVTLTIKYGQTLGADYMARALSALYRSARSTKSQNEILAIALAYSVVSNPEFIVS